MTADAGMRTPSAADDDRAADARRPFRRFADGVSAPGPGGGFAWAGFNPVHHLALHSAQLASLLQSLLILLLCFLPVWLMYRKRIFLKV